ncbi:hypothetical protein HPB50_023011 [Hyalomma asiaticum]|uniref:Uncharacterized protein n=1 Tax=Hyalomma asiaticum TaxID=266040 RepID=A0ACB7S9L9_HYAAI|nr:hypothetical protein HPB50_023011 [Hyalomma asiaticum]
MQTRLLELSGHSLDNAVKAALAMDACDISCVISPPGTRRRSAATASRPYSASLHVVAGDPPMFDMWHTGLVPLSLTPYMLTVEICGHHINMELNTGASVSGMAEELLRWTFPVVPDEASAASASCCGASLDRSRVRSSLNMALPGRRSASGGNLPLYLANVSSPMLLGRNRIHALDIGLP